jgi:hypothetical protein
MSIENAEEKNRADRTLTPGQINSLLEIVAQANQLLRTCHKGIIAAAMDLSKPTKAKTEKEIMSQISLFPSGEALRGTTQRKTKQ